MTSQKILLFISGILSEDDISILSKIITNSLCKENNNMKFNYKNISYDRHTIRTFRYIIIMLLGRIKI